jgi:uncharacterized protein involved in exopolysaccharide biosynthesis
MRSTSSRLVESGAESASDVAPDTASEAAAREAPSMLDYLYGVVRRGRMIIATTVVAALVMAVISLLMPSWYQARATFLPSPEERSPSALSAALSSIMNPIAPHQIIQAGDLSVSLMRSRRIRAALVEEFDLVERYRAADIEGALMAIEAHMSFRVGQEGIVTVMVEDREPETAAAIANRAVALLDRFNAEQRMTSGRSSRVFVEAQLDKTRQALEAAEDALGAYQAETRQVPLAPNIESAVTAGAMLLAEKLRIEMELEAKKRVLTDGSPELARLRAELAEVESRLEELPALNIEFARLVRDVKVQEKVYEFLRAQYEESMIREREDTPTLTVVDPATPPKLRARPRRKVMVASAGLVAGLVAALGALAATYVDLLPAGGRRREVLRATGVELRQLWRPGRRPSS